MHKNKSWALSRSRLATLMVMAISVSIGLVAGSSFISVEWLKYLIASMGSAGISIAGALLITEYWLKPTYTQDILDVVGVRDEIFQSGITHLRPEAQVPWEQIYGEAHEFVAIIADPFSFKARHWPVLCDIAKRRPIRLRLLVVSEPRNDSDDLRESAENTKPETPLVEFEHDWQRILKAGQFDRGSMLSIEPLLRPVTHSTYLTEERGVIILDHLAESNTGGSFALILQGPERSTVLRWLHDGLPILEQSVETPTWQSANWINREG